MDLGVTAVMLPELDFDEQIALCRECGVRYYQYRPRTIPEAQRGKAPSPWGNHAFDLTPERLATEGSELTRKLRDNGLEPCGTVPSVDIDKPDDEIRLHLAGAAAAEAGAIRLGPPAYPSEPFDYAAMLDRVVARYGEIIRTLSGPMGIKLILETHCRSFCTSPALAWNIVRHFPPDQIGVIFDMPNFAIEGEIRPVLAVSVLRDYIHCCHTGATRRVVTGVCDLGFKTLGNQMCPATEGDLHLPTWIRTLDAAGIQPPLVIEDFTPNLAGADRLRRSAAAFHSVLATL